MLAKPTGQMGGTQPSFVGPSGDLGESQGDTPPQDAPRRPPRPWNPFESREDTVFILVPLVPGTVSDL